MLIRLMCKLGLHSPYLLWTSRGYVERCQYCEKTL